MSHNCAVCKHHECQTNQYGTGTVCPIRKPPKRGAAVDTAVSEQSSKLLYVSPMPPANNPNQAKFAAGRGYPRSVLNNPARFDGVGVPRNSENEKFWNQLLSRAW